MQKRTCQHHKFHIAFPSRADPIVMAALCKLLSPIVLRCFALRPLFLAILESWVCSQLRQPSQNRLFVPKMQTSSSDKFASQPNERHHTTKLARARFALANAQEHTCTSSLASSALVRAHLHDALARAHLHEHACTLARARLRACARTSTSSHDDKLARENPCERLQLFFWAAWRG